MWEYNYYNPTELRHYGVRGMKWGSRRYRNGDGSLTDKGVKKYAKAGYREDSRKHNASATRRTHVAYANTLYNASSRQQNEMRAEQRMLQGRKRTRDVLGLVGGIAIADLTFNHGTMTKAALNTTSNIAKNSVKYAGRAFVTGYMKAKGHTNIKWSN